MKLDSIKYNTIGRSMYVLYPDGDRLSCYENTLITILLENDVEGEINALLADEDFCELADKQRFVMLFPNPINGRWNWDLDEAERDDLADLTQMVHLFNYQPDFNDRGIYHNMHNARYFMGIGTGASLLHTLAACNPVNVAGIHTIGGKCLRRRKQCPSMRRFLQYYGARTTKLWISSRRLTRWIVKVMAFYTIKATMLN